MEEYAYPRAGSRGDPAIAELLARLLAELAAQGVPPAVLGPTLVQAYARFARRLPQAGPRFDKSQVPLLYSLLGSGINPLLMAKKDAAYKDRAVGAQRCSNCSSAWEGVSTKDMRCSQVEGEIEPTHWCRLWNTDRR